jgi:hypothetical protein
VIASAVLASKAMRGEVPARLHPASNAERMPVPVGKVMMR